MLEEISEKDRKKFLSDVDLIRSRFEHDYAYLMAGTQQRLGRLKKDFYKMMSENYGLRFEEIDLLWDGFIDETSCGLWGDGFL